MRRSAHAYRLSLLLALACGLVLSGWHWQQVGLQGWGIGWLLLLPLAAQTARWRPNTCPACERPGWVCDRQQWRGGYCGAPGLGPCEPGLGAVVPAHTTAAPYRPHYRYWRSLTGPLEPALRLYTRRMTAMWGLLLLACGLISLGYLLLPALRLWPGCPPGSCPRRWRYLSASFIYVNACFPPITTRGLRST